MFIRASDGAPPGHAGRATQTLRAAVAALRALCVCTSLEIVVSVCRYERLLSMMGPTLLEASRCTGKKNIVVGSMADCALPMVAGPGVAINVD